jgi:hypothetical protein
VINQKNDKMKILIDWAVYTKVMLVVVALYYVIIGVKFFKYEILGWFGISKVQTSNASFVKHEPKEPVEG